MPTNTFQRAFYRPGQVISSDLGLYPDIFIPPADEVLTVLGKGI